MKPLIEILHEKKFVGKKIRMSFLNNKTFELWKSFMPCRDEITDNIGTELYSIEINILSSCFQRGNKATIINLKQPI